MPSGNDKLMERALRQFVYGLVVIGSQADGELNGMTANWVTQVSFEPRLVAIAVENEAHTRQLIDRGGAFSVNVLDQSRGRALGEIFVRPQARRGNKLGEVAFHPGAQTGCPILDEAIAAVECRVLSATETGDHILYVGEVVGAELLRDGTPVVLSSLGWHYAG